jgi:hypothetical protein
MAGGAVLLDLGRGRILPTANVSTRSPVLEAGILDSVVAGDIDIQSLFAGKSQKHPSQKASAPVHVSGS